jgi:hypothetical protein
MMDHLSLVNWLSAYKKSWETLDTNLILSLFTDDATYQVSPFAEPYQVRSFEQTWKSHIDRQGGNHITLEIWHLSGDIAIVQWIAHTIFFDSRGHRYGNGLFRLRFTGDGKCRELREWQHWHLPHTLALGHPA